MHTRVPSVTPPACARGTGVPAQVAKSQIGFFKFICLPFYDLVADLVDPSMQPHYQLLLNRDTWQAQLDSTKESAESSRTNTSVILAAATSAPATAAPATPLPPTDALANAPAHAC